MNSRLKDYYDLWTLSRTQPSDAASLVDALRNTFVRRGTPLPTEPPAGLTPAFFGDPSKQRQWRGFIGRGAPDEPAVSLQQVVEELASFLMPPAIAAATGHVWPAGWEPGRGWSGTQSVPEEQAP